MNDIDIALKNWICVQQEARGAQKDFSSTKENKSKHSAQRNGAV